MTGIRVFRKHLIPVCDDRHGAEVTSFVYDGAVIKGDAVTPVHLHQRRVETAFVLLVQVLFLQGKPDDELCDLIRQYGVVASRDILELRVGIERPPPNGHQIWAVLGGRRHPQVQPAQLFAEWAELMSLFRRNDDNALTLLAEPTAEALERDRLARAGRTPNPPISVGIFVIIIRIEKYRRSVIEVQPQKDAVVITQFIRSKGKCRSHTGSQSIAARLSFNIRIKCQNRKRG